METAMKKLRMDSAEDLPSPLFEISWEQDKQFRMDPGVVTSLLREQVPVLDFVQWTVTSIEPGVTESVLPLNPQSTNQHFTHQAALCVLAADYTGGTALASLLSGWAILGQSARSPGEVGPDRQKRRPGLNSRICHGAQDSRAWNEKGPRRIAGLLRVQEVRTQARRRRAATSPPRPSRAMLPEVGTIWPETCVATLLRF